MSAILRHILTRFIDVTLYIHEDAIPVYFLQSAAVLWYRDLTVLILLRILDTLKGQQTPLNASERDIGRGHETRV